MLKKQKAKKLAIYLDETEQWHGRALYEAIIEFLHTHHVAGVSLFRGFAGYGQSRVLHTPKILRLSENLPIKLEVIESPEVIERLLPEIAKMVRKGLIEISDSDVIRFDDPAAGPH